MGLCLLAVLVGSFAHFSIIIPVIIILINFSLFMHLFIIHCAVAVIIIMYLR